MAPVTPPPAPPPHALQTHPRVPPLMALWALPLALGGAQLLGSLLADAASFWLGPGPAGLTRMLAGVAGGGLCLATLALWLPLLSRVPLRHALGLRTAPPGVFVAAAVGTFMLGPLADVLMRSAQALFPDSTLGTLLRLQALSRSQPLWLLWPFFALLPGLSEELFFRGMLQNAFARPRVGMWLAALCFAAFHLDPHHVAGVLPLGIFLSWVGMRFGTVVTIAAHVVNNSVALLTARVAELDVGYGTDQPMPLPVVLGSGVCVALCIGVLRQHAPTRSGMAGPTRA